MTEPLQLDPRPAAKVAKEQEEILALIKAYAERDVVKPAEPLPLPGRVPAHKVKKLIAKTTGWKKLITGTIGGLIIAGTALLGDFLLENQGANISAGLKLVPCILGYGMLATVLIFLGWVACAFVYGCLEFAVKCTKAIDKALDIKD